MDLKSIEWVAELHLEGERARGPQWARINGKPKDRSLDQMLASGDIDALMLPRPPELRALLLKKDAGEAFADRGYSDDGTLAPRGRPGAMIEDEQKAVAQALGMIEQGSVTSLSGRRLPVAPDTLCLHGDQPDAVAFAKARRRAFAGRGIAVGAP